MGENTFSSCITVLLLKSVPKTDNGSGVHSCITHCNFKFELGRIPRIVTELYLYNLTKCTFWGKFLQSLVMFSKLSVDS